MPWKIPKINKCCGCVTDLKTAVAIIAVLGIVTSPAVSWAVVRHSYVVRVSCYITTSENRPDVVDINLNNILSFGFGANAGLGPSCLGPKSKTAKPPTKDLIFARVKENTVHPTSPFVDAVKYVGWIVLFADLVFLFTSLYFLYRIFYGPDIKAAQYFTWAACTSIILSFVYGLLYITACVSIGGAFPIFELVFCLVDALVWLYFLIVVLSYRRMRPQL